MELGLVASSTYKTISRSLSLDFFLNGEVFSIHLQSLSIHGSSYSWVVDLFHDEIQFYNNDLCLMMWIN